MKLIFASLGKINFIFNLCFKKIIFWGKTFYFNLLLGKKLQTLRKGPFKALTLILKTNEINRFSSGKVIFKLYYSSDKMSENEDGLETKAYWSLDCLRFYLNN